VAGAFTVMNATPSLISRSIMTSDLTGSHRTAVGVTGVAGVAF